LDLTATKLPATLDPSAATTTFDLNTAATSATFNLNAAATLDFDIAATTSALKKFASTAPAPAVPALPAAPTQAGTPSITAPVPARTLPPVVIPAKPPPAEEELDVLDHVETIDRGLNCVGRTDRRRFDTTDQRSARNQCGRC
jgi:hypothetical protein